MKIFCRRKATENSRKQMMKKKYDEKKCVLIT